MKSREVFCKKTAGLVGHLAIFVAVAACGDLAKKPVDARTRDLIDSAFNAQSRQVRSQLDTFYNRNHPALLKQAMDSLMAERRKEIEKEIRSARGGK